MHRTLNRPLRQPGQEAARRLAAMCAMALMPVIAYALGRVAWDQAHVVANGMPWGSWSGLATLSLGQILSPVAAAIGTLVAAHLTWTTLVMLAAPRQSRARAAVVALTPTAWRRLVTIAATGTLSAALAVPATAAVGTTTFDSPTLDTTDAGWVSAPVEATTEPTDPTGKATTHQDGTDARATHASALVTQAEQDANPSSAREVVVEAGDTLWDITAAQLDIPADDHRAIVAAWPELYEENRETIGADPGLIVPDQRLSIPAGWTA